MGANISKRYSSFNSLWNLIQLFLNFVLSGPRKSTLWIFEIFEFTIFLDFVFVFVNIGSYGRFIKHRRSLLLSLIPFTHTKHRQTPTFSTPISLPLYTHQTQTFSTPISQSLLPYHRQTFSAPLSQSLYPNKHRIYLLLLLSPFRPILTSPEMPLSDLQPNHWVQFCFCQECPWAFRLPSLFPYLISHTCLHCLVEYLTQILN